MAPGDEILGGGGLSEEDQEQRGEEGQRGEGKTHGVTTDKEEVWKAGVALIVAELARVPSLFAKAAHDVGSLATSAAGGRALRHRRGAQWRSGILKKSDLER